MLELPTPETMNLFGREEKVIDRTMTGENVPTLDVVKVFLVQCNLLYNQYQQSI